jgi:hypothetical protein
MIELILAAAAALAVIILVILNWDRIIDWFHGREKLVQSDKDNIAVVIKQHMDDGKYNTVQGIFNKRTNELLDGAKYKTEELDEKTIENFGDKEMIICT